jgi:hypothetical protein
MSTASRSGELVLQISWRKQLYILHKFGDESGDQVDSFEEKL